MKAHIAPKQREQKEKSEASNPICEIYEVLQMILMSFVFTTFAFGLSTLSICTLLRRALCCG